MRAFLLFLSLGILVSCERIAFPKAEGENATAVFRVLWNTLDEGYSFFEYKQVNWDSIKTVYEPRIYDGMPDQELFSVCSQMLNELKDGHVNLRSGFDISYYPYHLDRPANMNKELLDHTYWRGFSITGPLLHTVIDSVGYVYYGSFQRKISEAQLDVVINRFANHPGIKGVIIDVRSNEGGDPINGQRILERVPHSGRKLLYYTKYKNGPGHNDFTQPQPSYYDEKGGDPKWPGKLVILTNRKCYSACNFFVAASKQYPLITRIGDKTGGGGGQPNGFELPNGWSINFSGSITYMPDGTIIEHGVEPDIHIDMDPMDVLNNKDTIIETALDYIRS